MKIVIERLTFDDPDGSQGRLAWTFQYSAQNGFRLERYAEETRKNKRCKWVGLFWSSMDERRYFSKFSRPVNIPANVIAEAKRTVAEQIHKAPVYIGWFNEEHKL